MQVKLHILYVLTVNICGEPIGAAVSLQYFSKSSKKDKVNFLIRSYITFLCPLFFMEQ